MGVQRKTLNSLVEQEIHTLATEAPILRKRFAELHDHGRRFANLLVTKTVEARERIRRQQESLVKAMDRILSLALPQELGRAKNARHAVSDLHDVVIDIEFEVEQLEARKRHSLKKRVPHAKLQVTPKKLTPKDTRYVTV